MMSKLFPQGVSRRDLLKVIGLTAGSAAMYQAMTSLGMAQESSYKGPIKLEGDAKGATVLILGAGLAGLTAAIELQKVGYKVKILEYNDRTGGRNWSIRGGDKFTDISGETQTCEFDEGFYINPGPWRIPYHHHAVLDYCRRFSVKLEPFQQINHNAYLHGTKAFGGKPQRVRDIMSDFRGGVSELLGKAAHTGKLDGLLKAEDTEMLVEAMRSWGVLDADLNYKSSLAVSEYRGFAKEPGGGLNAAPVASDPIAFGEILNSGLWAPLANFALYEFQTTMFEPVGGMDNVGKAFAKEAGDVVTFNAKVTSIQQDEKGVTVAYEDTTAPGTMKEEKADWCICTIPLTILSQIDIDVGSDMSAAIAAVTYADSMKVGLQFKRRFWEEDEHIFGGITYTDLPISQLSYPSNNFNLGGKGVLLGGYTWNTPASYEMSSLSAADRVKSALEQGLQIHPQYKDEFENGVSWAWHRSPFTLGCAGDWTEETRKEHYDDLCQIDGRIVLAGEHASYIPAWMEGAILSSLDAIERLHKRVMQG